MKRPFEEKRVYPRRPWRGRVVFEDEFGQGLIFLHALDISLGGIFLKEVPPIQTGTHLFLSFVLPGKSRPLKATGQVVRFVEHGEEGKKNRGVGIRFVHLPEASFKGLAKFLS